MPVPAAPLAWALLIAISAVCARLPIPTRGNRALMRCCCRLASPHPVLTPPGRAHYPIKGCQPLGLIRRTRCVKELRTRLDRLARAALCAAWVNYALTHGIVKRKRAVLMRKRMIYCNRT